MRRPRFRYHHLGMPTSERREDETYLEAFRVHVTSHKADPFRIEWMRFEDDAPVPELVKRVPHLAFQVEDLDSALEGHEVLIPPNSPSEEVRVAFIVHGGVPVEFLEFSGQHPDRLVEEGEGEQTYG